MFGAEEAVAVEEARGSYESFDCAQAVALIGFIGLLSNFQDIIEEFTDLINGNRKRSVNSQPWWLPSHTPFGSLHWDGLLDSVLRVVQWDEKGRKTEMEEGEVEEEEVARTRWDEHNEGKKVGKEPRKSERMKEVEEEQNMLWLDIQDEEMEDDLEDKTKPNLDSPARHSLLSHLARVGPKMAMWVVDTSDGRVTGEEGRAGICRAFKSLSRYHGWLGTLSSNLLLQTLSNAVSHHQPSRTRLTLAGLSEGTPIC